jgi:hypothetical protein
LKNENASIARKTQVRFGSAFIKITYEIRCGMRLLWQVWRCRTMANRVWTNNCAKCAKKEKSCEGDHSFLQKAMLFGCLKVGQQNR